MPQRAALDSPVIDKTGLAARFDFELEWTPEESQFGGDLFTAMQQQIGLKLEAPHGMVASHPSEN